MGAYEAFIAAKRHSASEHGFEPIFMPECAFDFQREIILRAVRKGRVGVFADTGLGKTLIELSIAENVARFTGNREATVADARDDRLRTLLETVRRIGNVTPAALAPITGRSERWCREQLHELERRGQLYSWTPRRNVARMLGAVK